jgi:hypothetical protein
MDHLIRPLEHLLSRAGTFAANRRLRLLRVTTDEETYHDALRALVGLEWSPRNRQHFIDTTRDGEGPADWSACRERIIDAYGGIRTAYRGRDLALEEVTVDRPTGDPLVCCAVAAQRIAHILSSPPAPTEGIVIVLGVGAFTDHALLGEQLSGIIDAPGLAEARWAVVERGEPVTARLAKKLGPAALDITCHIDREQQRAEVDGLLDALTNAAANAVGPARMGGAKPDVAPPPRPGAPAPPIPSPTSAHIPSLLQGVKALGRGDLPRAVQFQREALTSCLAANHITNALEMEILLAIYLGQLALTSGDTIQPAVESFEGAIAKASGAGLLSTGARAALLEGVLANAAGDRPTAVLALHRASLLAKTAGAPELRAEALRMAADLIARAGLDERAAELRAQAARGGPGQRPRSTGGEE